MSLYANGKKVCPIIKEPAKLQDISPVTENGTYNVSGDYTGFASPLKVDVDESFNGFSMKDFMYWFPAGTTVIDDTAPYIDWSSLRWNYPTYWMCYGLRKSRVKAFMSPVMTSDGQQCMAYLSQDNKCIRYLEINYATNISSSYSVYSPCANATNLKVFTINFTNVDSKLYGSYHPYWCGASATTTGIKSFRADGLVDIYGASAFSYAGGNNKELQSMWFPDLVGVGKGGTGSSTMQRIASNCTELKNVFFPKLQQIGYNATGSYYGYMSYFNSKVTNQKLQYLYFPALTTIYCVGTSTSYGTFANSTGVFKWYFPRLSVAQGTATKNMLYACTNTTEIHFGKANQTAVEGFDGYSTKWGATNATIYFDLINDITVGGVSYTRRQDNDYMTSLTYGGKTYYRDDSARDAHNIRWKFWAWKSNDGAVVYTQNPLAMADEYVWEYISGERWDYNTIGKITSVDWRYGWTDASGNTIYTTNQWTPSVGDMTYSLSSDGKSFANKGSITEAV